MDPISGYIFASSQLKFVSSKSLNPGNNYDIICYSLPGARLTGAFKQMPTIIANLKLPKRNFAVIYLGGNDLDARREPRLSVFDIISAMCNFVRFVLFELHLVEKVFVYTLAPRHDFVKNNLHKEFNRGILNELHVLRLQGSVVVLNCSKFFFAKGSLRENMTKRDGYHLTSRAVTILLRSLAVSLQQVYNLRWNFRQIFCGTTCSKCQSIIRHELCGHNSSQCVAL